MSYHRCDVPEHVGMEAEIQRLRDGIRDIVRDGYCCHECFDNGSKAPFSEEQYRLLELIDESR